MTAAHSLAIATLRLYRTNGAGGLEMKVRQNGCGIRGLGLFTLIALPLLSAAAPAPQAADPVLGQRGDITVTTSQVREMLRNVDPAVRAKLEANPAALAAYVRDRLLQLTVLEEAHAHQWDTRPEVVWRADRAREASIADGYVASLSEPPADFPSAAQVQAAYDANKARLMVPRQYHLAQIYLAVPADAPASADKAAQKKLQDLRAQLLRPHADFAAAARRVSEDRVSATGGGDLGWVREDHLLPPVREAVAGLTDGSISEPVRAGDGWHLVKLLGMKPAGPATLADVHDALVRALRQQKQHELAQAYVNGLMKQQPIQINEIGIAQLVPAK